MVMVDRVEINVKTGEKKITKYEHVPVPESSSNLISVNFNDLEKLISHAKAEGWI